ncbi:retrovirus-related Pol polyprotein from transposon 17.6 [Trichonephila clavipes]|uniref:Retrovirus-related Pol polyprotein from transposon 17.6 n=1 Tax=Trichonephila clavipes TaxID=2585209 RepID=A0A8X6R9N1_TRICX|nr:retrovirus-related Pol polyprotein from transposon 17.6 [Trichonephila clavipes]
MYGRDPKGPLSLLKSIWTGNTLLLLNIKGSVKSYLKKLKEKLEVATHKEKLTSDVQQGSYAKYCHTHNLLQVPIAELAERWTELPQVSDESRSFFRVHTGYFSNIPKCIKAEFIASWACSQSSVVSSSQR